MADRYRLPEALGGGECEIVERDPALTLVGKPAHVVHVVDENEYSAYAVVHAADLIKVEPPLPPEPPLWAVVVDTNGRAWQHMDDFRGDWACTVADLGADWDELQEHAPLTRLVPDPAAGVELPWRGGHPGAPFTVSEALTVSEAGQGGVAMVSSPGPFILDTASARAMAGAVLAAVAAHEARGAP